MRGDLVFGTVLYGCTVTNNRPIRLWHVKAASTASVDGLILFNNELRINAIMTLHTVSCQLFAFIVALSTTAVDQRNWAVNAFSSQPKAAPSKSETNSKHDEPKNVNFVDWISDAPNEIRNWKSLKVDSAQNIPSFVRGTLIRNGCGIWTTNDEMFSHIFDGLAKIHSYRITHQQSDSEDENSASVEYQARFLEGMWYKSYMENTESLPFGVGTGPVLDKHSKEPKAGPLRIAQALWNTVTKFDNTPVNIWDYQPDRSEADKPITAMTDAPPRTEIDLRRMDTLSSSTMNKFAKGAKGYEMLCTSKFNFELAVSGPDH